MIKKVPQSFENMYGIEITSGEFPKKPCLLGIMPINNNIRHNNGYLNLFMQLLQIRKSGAVDSDYDINDIPFDLLIDNEQEEFVTLTLNAIPSNNIMEAKKIMRNINILSYCDGNAETGIKLKKIYVGLIEKGYTTEEAKEILSQIFVLQVVDNYKEGYELSEIPYATVVTVHDIFDMENDSYEDTLFETNPFIYTKSKDNNDRYVIYKSFGEGSLSKKRREHDFSIDYAGVQIISHLIALYLIQALHMSLNNIELNGNLSLQKEIDSLVAKVLEFAKTKNKHYDDFTKEDLSDLSNILREEIKNKFKEKIPVKLISKEEQEYLNERDLVIRNCSKINGGLDLDYYFKQINDVANKIYDLNDNFKDDDIAYYEYSNSGTIEYKKDSAISLHFDLLSSKINSFMKVVNQLTMLENMPSRVRSELTEYITSFLNRLKNLINNDKMLHIIEMYATKEQQESFRI